MRKFGPNPAVSSAADCLCVRSVQPTVARRARLTAVARDENGASRGGRGGPPLRLLRFVQRISHPTIRCYSATLGRRSGPLVVALIPLVQSLATGWARLLLLVQETPRRDLIGLGRGHPPGSGPGRCPSLTRRECARRLDCVLRLLKRGHGATQDVCQSRSAAVPPLTR